MYFPIIKHDNAQFSMKFQDFPIETWFIDKFPAWHQRAKKHLIPMKYPYGDRYIPLKSPPSWSSH